MLDRTGPFQPSPSPFQSHYSDEPSTTFGIDLRKYDETNANKETQPVPQVLEILLKWAEKKGKEASDEGACRFPLFSASRAERSRSPCY